jgi:hypothetical protein
MIGLDPSHSRLIGDAACEHLGENARRMARLDDVVQPEKPTDDRSPKRIDCYQVMERSASGAAFKLDPSRLSRRR